MNHQKISLLQRLTLKDFFFCHFLQFHEKQTQNKQ